MAAWEVEYTDQFLAWWDSLSIEEQAAIDVAVEVLQEKGPALRRPLVDTIKSSRHANMKELIPLGGFMRVLFAFDPRRMAILLIGGDKQNQWEEWYLKMVPIADQLLDEHLMEIEKKQ